MTINSPLHCFSHDQDEDVVPSEDCQRLDVAIVGSGIAGLGAAIALSRNGHNVEVFERSGFTKEVGAAMHICPNASRVLLKWGFDFKAAKAMAIGQGRVLNGESLETQYLRNYDYIDSMYDAPWCSFHRVDLHNELKRLAQEPVAGTKLVKIRLECEVVGVDFEAGTIVLADGAVHKKDLVVVADGIHSSIAQKFIGPDNPVYYSGRSVFRFIIPGKDLVAKEELRDLFDPPGMNLAVVGDKLWVWYHCRNNQLVNFVCHLPDDPEWKEKLESDSYDGMGHIVDTYKKFHPKLLDICKYADKIAKPWPLFARKPITEWTKGYVVLIGDAAHPMLPHQGQGACQAIEDGGALSVMFSNIRSKAELPVRLRLFQEVRCRRVGAIQVLSRFGADRAEMMAEAGLWVQPVPQTIQEFHDYIFSYNVFEHCIEVLKGAGMHA